MKTRENRERRTKRKAMIIAISLHLAFFTFLAVVNEEKVTDTFQSLVDQFFYDQDTTGEDHGQADVPTALPAS